MRVDYTFMLCSTITMYVHMLNKITLGVKKVQDQSEAALQIGI